MAQKRNERINWKLFSSWRKKVTNYKWRIIRGKIQLWRRGPFASNFTNRGFTLLMFSLQMNNAKINKIHFFDTRETHIKYYKFILLTYIWIVTNEHNKHILRNRAHYKREFWRSHFHTLIICGIFATDIFKGLHVMTHILHSVSQVFVVAAILCRISIKVADVQKCLFFE